jgi:DNA-binding MarR family transcriptional regulator
VVSQHDQDLARVSTWRTMLYAHDRLFKRLGEEMLHERDLEISWYEVLLHLSEAGGQITQRDLLERTLMGQSGLSRILSRMEAEHLVERASVEGDRRILLVTLTRRGRERLRRAAPTHIGGIKRWFGDRLTARQAEAMKAGLDKVLRGLEDDEQPPPGPLSAVAIGQSMVSLSSDAVSVTDTILVRDALEPLVLTDAVRYATARDVGELRELVTTMVRRINSPVEFLRADWQLHRRIAEISPNQALQQVYSMLVSTLEQNVEEIVPSTDLPTHVQERLRLHAELVEAIAAGDAEAVSDIARQRRLAPGDSDEHNEPADKARAQKKA